ncbi:PspC domain-containing protein [Nocardioides jensenii]|uniref:PspC domain-containing protein n=1 Tax=Nocardioides jensenii TaxID=1843 RepID=UPI00083472E1|nr:PspC domain-containing protein [Nocardioides jensenii]
MNENPTTDGTEAPYGPQPENDQGPRVSGEQMRDLSALRRSTWDKHVAGVAGGLGRHFDVDPVIIRVAFVVLTFFGGAGLIIYVACWLLVPEDTGQRATVHLDARSRNVALLGVGVLAGLALIGDAWGPGWFPWPLFVIGLIAWVVLARRDRNRSATWRETGNGHWVGPAPTPGADTAAGHWVGTTHAPGRGPVPPAPPMAPMPPLLPRNPRKRGPILFWFTLALIAVSCGVLGIFDLAGAGITDSAYPALALGVIAVMLLVGAFYGRAGGLIFLGLVTAVVLAGSTIAARWEGSDIDATPASASALKSSYDMEAGEMDIDLTQIRDLDALDGRTIDLEAEVGSIQVIVPRGLHVSVDSTVEIGEITLFGDGTGGLDLDLQRTNLGDADRPHLHINADLELGEVEVTAR